MVGGPSDATLASLAGHLGPALLRARLKLTTAESCTGGWIAKVVTDVAGSSEWFEGGFVTYSNALKQTLLGVTTEDLRRHGAVSERVAAAMAEGARNAAGADCAVAVSGIAGPGGGLPDKPVGTVCFAWTLPGSATTTACERFAGDREQVRRCTVERALSTLLARLGA